MKVKLTKKKLKSLTNDGKFLSEDLTPKVAGGKPTDSGYTHFCTILAVCRTY
ncbi:hypothetical protein [Pseudoalteromonas luteoviolacea]|uniref:Uncharacterized protein n=1 Tax=Pseudoalteromonas luteoviolacea DSM 6061 TaxID=1365250 RepID=A0A166WA94_9GAMM|nr:hypothetical protein [Pseudoalteromonas luteoviolacea]KZN36664.1 hypothetical protein N475_17210 [Pseudoalteromonas luteoviolacea DSM 6061]KZN51846.1 hypothetical protein N474_23640 [Pseudoalteromonas luteoviolacea CPMOR-2]MBE0390105.1 hypothetical protein [Pseudoalteromonas luteoviolacea DSM 6061]